MIYQRTYHLFGIDLSGLISSYLPWTHATNRYTHYWHRWLGNFLAQTASWVDNNVSRLAVLTGDLLRERQKKQK